MLEFGTIVGTFLLVMSPACNDRKDGKYLIFLHQAFKVLECHFGAPEALLYLFAVLAQRRTGGGDIDYPARITQERFENLTHLLQGSI